MALKGYEEIVENDNCPTLVLAGPGAGKTYLLSDHVVRLLRKGVVKSNITVATFGKDASLNMREELLDPAGNWKLNIGELPKIATLHSLCFKIINENPKVVGLRKSGLSVQHNELVKELLYRDASYIRGYEKEDGKNARLCKSKGDCEPDDDNRECDICKEYWEIMAKCDRIDFDDQILFACKILETNPDVLQEFQEKAEHLLVDEYQDINAAQHKLIELLSRNNRSGLFAVGDDAQSIYGFRGANPDFILNFQNYYPEAETQPLLHSRRCHELILRNAEKVLIDNYASWTGPFNLEFHRETDDEPYVWQMPSEVAEAKQVARLSKKYTGLGMSVLILSPKKEIFGGIAKALTKASVPHVCPASLLPAHTERRLEALNTIGEWVQKPRDNFLTRLSIEAAINGGVARIPGAKGNKNLKKETIERRMNAEEEVALLWNAVTRKKDLFQVLTERDDLTDDLLRVKDVLSDLLDKYENPKSKESGEFLKLASLITGSWAKPNHFVDDVGRITRLLRESGLIVGDSVRLMTMRKAKGLEADVVIMVGLEDDIIPNPRSDVEEEARIFYVSMTRAIKKLYMLHAYRRPRNISYGPDMEDKPRSRFLDSVGIESKYIRKKHKERLTSRGEST